MTTFFHNVTEQNHTSYESNSHENNDTDLSWLLSASFIVILLFLLATYLRGLKHDTEEAGNAMQRDLDLTLRGVHSTR